MANWNDWYQMENTEGKKLNTKSLLRECFPLYYVPANREETTEDMHDPWCSPRKKQAHMMHTTMAASP